MENKDTSGFYKNNNGEWHYAPNYVMNKLYTLHRDSNRDSMDGWLWYDEAPQEYIDWYKQMNPDEDYLFY